MMDPLTLASRRFKLADQERFANVSGDHNPMHLDAILARRTRAAAPVVHGVHLLLWTLDAFAANYPRPPACAAFGHDLTGLSMWKIQRRRCWRTAGWTAYG